MDTTLADRLVGRVLEGRYRVESRLARGGMATVYRALDSRLDRIVALKVMHPGLAEDDQFVSRFIREARSAARLSHPNVVSVFDQGADDGHVFLAMEYVEGRTLRDLLREQGTLTPRQALDVLESVLAALGAAHHAGIVHRDVKPENVLLADDGRVKVADFGLARAVTGATSHTSATGVVMGTVAYLAPEQVERGVADPRSDVYAAGILFFELLTGRKPYEGETAIQVAYRHVHDDVPAPSSFVPTVPAELDALVARATSRDPDGRPADARRFLAEVVQVRRALSDAELDAGGSGSGPAGGPSGPADHTLVVPLPQARTRRAARRRSADTGPTRVPTRRSRRGPVALLLVLLLATALSGAAWYLAAGPGAYTSAPRLVGLSQQQAAARAEAGGFSLRVAGREYDEQVPVGHVLSTDPGPTERIRKDGTIRVVLSRGPERYAVPDLRGKSRAEAERALAASHLSVGDVTSAYDDDVDRGDVVSTSPAPGELRKRDTAVALVLSKGVEPVPVPAVVGRPLDEAKAELAAAGLGAAVTEKYDDGVALGVVISQQPAKGTAPKGSEVRLVVSKGPPPVPVPNVTDLKLGEATRILERAGFRVRVQGTRFINRVFDQSPKGNTEAPRGSTVTLRTI